MFADTPTVSTFAVDDLDRAREFYSGTLGLRTSDHEMGLLVLHPGDGRDIVVYPKPDHAPAGFTVLNFVVDDIGAAVDALVAAGVQMERYEGFDQDERGIASAEGPPIAWFRDPAGNVLSVMKVV